MHFIDRLKQQVTDDNSCTYDLKYQFDDSDNNITDDVSLETLELLIK